jgi:hypothetical protein
VQAMKRIQSRRRDERQKGDLEIPFDSLRKSATTVRALKEFYVSMDRMSNEYRPGLDGSCRRWGGEEDKRRGGGDVCGGTNEVLGWRLVKDQSRRLPFGGHSPVITTIGYGDSTHRSLLNPCQVVHGGPPGEGGHDEFRATGAGKDASRGRLHASLVRLMVLRHFC